MVSDNNDISLDVNLGIDHILDIGNAENIPYPLPPTLLSPSATQLDVCVYAQAYLYNKERNSPFMTPEQALMWLVRFGVGPCRSRRVYNLVFLSYGYSTISRVSTRQTAQANQAG